MEKQTEIVSEARDGKVKLSLVEKLEQKKKRVNEKLDEELKQTFPASDPISYY